MGWKNLNYLQTLLCDDAIHTTVNPDHTQPSAFKLSRFKNQVARHTTRFIDRMFVETFAAITKSPPAELKPDFDATDNLLPGNQEKTHHYSCYGN